MLAGVVAMVILATNLPVGSLLSQASQQRNASAELQRVDRLNRALVIEKRQLGAPGALNVLARQNYQLVPPGQTLYEVLPPGGSAPGHPGTTNNDPGAQAPVPPAEAPGMSPDPNLTPASAQVAPPSGSNRTDRGGTATRASTGFWSRVARSLQFWR